MGNGRSRQSVPFFRSPSEPAGLAADWQSADDESVKRVGLVHGLLNVTATSLFGASWFLRKGRKRRAARALAFLGYGIAFFSAYLGGEMVYRMGMGVRR
ncbi:MAG TPA: DUF2231 domain-containing protein [Chthonomonadaceae bacterium]|nr:DUF2231 domain-containing protein [Chthonomonadaceae bacterium]